MAGYIGIDGVARKVSRLYTGVGGVARSVTKAYVGDAGGKARLWYQAGKPLGGYAVGSIVWLRYSGVWRSFLIVQQGTPDAAAYGNADGTWLLSSQCLHQGLFGSTSPQNQFKGSYIEEQLNTAILQKFDASVQSLMHRVTFPSYSYSSADGHKDTQKIFIPSMNEAGFDGYAYQEAADTSCVTLEYFKDAPADGSSVKRIAQLYSSGSNIGWWTRTPYRYARTTSYAVTTTGGCSYSYTNSRYSLGYRPMFVLPSDTPIDGNGRIGG